MKNTVKMCFLVNIRKGKMIRENSKISGGMALNGSVLNLKEILYELLNEKDIQDKIIDIVGVKESRGSYTDREAMEQELNNVRQELDKIKKNLKDEITEKSELKKELIKTEEELKKAREDENRLKEKMKSVMNVIEVWDSLQTLDRNVLNYLDDLCGVRSLLAYIALGKNLNGIDQLWGQIRLWAIDDSSDAEMLEVLRDYFDICIQTYNDVNSHNDDGKNKFEEIAVIEGGDYDSDKYIKTSKSQYNGKISEVLVRGYINHYKKKEYLPIVKLQ